MPNVSFTPELERFAETCIRSGCYGSVSEGTRAALLASLQEAELEGEYEGFLTPDEVAAEVRSAIEEATTQRA